jgi:Uma2 family endonuclease
MATVQVPHGRSLVLDNVDWRTYSRLLRAFDGRRSVRMTYDRGWLEIMMASYQHEGPAYLLGRCVDVLTEELNLTIAGGGSTTFRKRRKLRGLEPDNCYWIYSEPKIRGKKRIDLRVDPPPDLAIEIEVSRRVLKRLPIYAALGVPELWRYDGQHLAFLILDAGQYLEQPSSKTFPGLSSADLARVLALEGQMDVNAMIKQFRAWVRQQIATGILKPG